jgi:hypothetical protein
MGKLRLEMKANRESTAQSVNTHTQPLSLTHTLSSCNLTRLQTSHPQRKASGCSLLMLKAFLGRCPFFCLIGASNWVHKQEKGKAPKKKKKDAHPGIDWTS